MSLESAEGVDEASRDEDGPRSVYRSPRQDLALNLDEKRLASALTTREGLLWVLLTPEHEDSRRLMQDVFGFHRLAIDDCTNERVDTPKVDDYTDYLFIVAQSVDASDGWAKLHLEELDVFLGPNYVVTIKSTGALPSIDRLFEDACSGGQVLEHGADFLAHSVLDVIVDELLPAVEAIDWDEVATLVRESYRLQAPKKLASMA
jgi:magnesium transporter